MATAVYATKFSALLTSLQDLQKFLSEGITYSTEAAKDLEHSLRDLPLSFHSSSSNSAIPSSYTDANYDEQTLALSDTIPSYLERNEVLDGALGKLKELRARLANGEEVPDPIAELQSAIDLAQRDFKSGSEKLGLMQYDEYHRFQREVWEKRYPNTPFKEPKNKSRQTYQEDSDEDLVITTQVQSLIDPLTQTHLEDPVTSSDCLHSFSRATILQYLGRAPHKECPVAGCRKYIRKSDLEPNPRLAREVARKRREEEEERRREEEYYTNIE